MHQPDHQGISKGILGTSNNPRNFPGHLQGQRTFPCKNNKRKSCAKGTERGRCTDTKIHGNYQS